MAGTLSRRWIQLMVYGSCHLSPHQNLWGQGLGMEVSCLGPSGSSTQPDREALAPTPLCVILDRLLIQDHGIIFNLLQNPRDFPILLSHLESCHFSPLA